MSSKASTGSFSGNGNASVDSEIEIPKDVADKVWEYGVSVDGEDAIQCKFCDDIVTGGLYRFIRHLAGSEHGGEACEYGCYGDDDDDDEEEEGCACVGVGEKRKGGEAVDNAGSSEGVCKKMRDRVEAKSKGVLREEACEAIARFFYDCAIPLEMVESKEFIEMCDAVSGYGVGFEPPSCDEIGGKYLRKAVKLTNDILEEHRAVWKVRGCSIMVDAWTDKKKRSILNLLVNSIKGTVFLKTIDASDMLESSEKLFKMMDDIVEEVGEENVVQIVTDYTPYYKAAGEMLMEKRSRLYWTPCVTHCIEMILEDYEKKVPVYDETIRKGKRITTFIYSRASVVSLLHNFTEGVDLVKQAITRCATSYLTLASLLENKGALRRMFTSKEWKSSQFAKTIAGRSAEDVVLDKEFWKNVTICLKGANPLIDVLRLVNSIGKPATGFIYEAMKQAKLEILKNLSKGCVESLMPLWEIIDERWDKQLHNPLYAAGYFLNQQFHYSYGFREDNLMIESGLHHCITRMVTDPEERAKIETQLDDFDKRANLLGRPTAVMTARDEVPSVWWDAFGGELPELQKLACRVLSLTCSSHGGERDRKAFEMVHAKKRNLLRQKNHNDVVFVTANSKLAEKKQAKGVKLNLDDIGDIEGLDVDDLDFDTSYQKSLDDMISDLDDEFSNGDELGDEDGDGVFKSFSDLIDDLHNRHVIEDEDEDEDEDGDEDEDDQMEDYDLS
ncbi:uncharacterized protein LOC131598872 [Vicia villosa]|uniref:uncharacterized protein LOC131598872 n=1 Tax=Vicia villosa TaxID=3911 RepID=UPI00273B41B1|nr:uncharacterized protein LOC131598872 [Vicia villosa]